MEKQSATEKKVMKAIICTKYGSPEVFQLEKVEKPTPKENEILVKIHTASATPADCAFRRGEPFLVRIMYGLKAPRFAILGVEFSGTVEAIGSKVTLFQPGEEVFGISPDHFGTYTEYLCLEESKPVVEKSKQLPFEDATAITDGATTALTFLRDVAKLKKGQRVLINGASGAVGIYAVQLAHYFSAEVTGVCSTTNMALVKSMGADHVIDYTKEDFTLNDQTYDVIFDAVASSSYSKCKNRLTQSGVYLTTMPTLMTMLQMLWTSAFSQKKAKFAATGLMQTAQNLQLLNQLFDDGHIRAVIDRRYALAEVSDAHRYVETGRKKGNVIINVSGS